MNILVFTNSFKGLYTFRKEVIQAAMDKGHSVIISAPFDDGIEKFKEMGCELIDSHFNRKSTNPFKDLALVNHYRKLLKQFKPDVVLSYTIKPNVYGGLACRMLHVPQIANITGLGSVVENKGWLQKITIMLYKIGLKKTYRVFFQNEANRQFCLDHKMVNPSHQALIPGSGVNLQHHYLQDYPKENQPVRFVFISRLMKEKGIEQYLEVATRIKEKHPEMEFHIFGNSEEGYAERVSLLQQQGVVVYHGYQNDLRPFLAQYHCTVHPSFYPEGMSNVLLESCAAGRPIITTDRPGCREIVDDGVNGFVVRQRDADDLEKKIEQFISLPYHEKRQMGLNGRKKVENGFDRRIVIDAYLSAIGEIEILKKRNNV